jgi:hypothetical protein
MGKRNKKRLNRKLRKHSGNSNGAHQSTPWSERLSFGRLLAASPRQTEKLDIALRNLAFASGLPGPGPGVEECLEQLDEMTRAVDLETKRHYYRFLDSPTEYNKSQGHFCVLMMITVLQQDFGVKYNPDRIRDPDFTDSRDLFIHGIISGRGGTCVSMPVLYVAVGRRLGYPLKLVNAPAHLFCRWDDSERESGFGRDRFNIEASGVGLNSHPDEFYHTWPLKVPAHVIQQGSYLYSLTAREENAVFAATRAHCLLDNGRYEESLSACKLATQFAPHDPQYEVLFKTEVRNQIAREDEAIERVIEHSRANRARRDALSQRASPSSPFPVGLPGVAAQFNQGAPRLAANLGRPSRPLLERDIGTS